MVICFNYSFQELMHINMWPTHVKILHSERTQSLKESLGSFQAGLMAAPELFFFNIYIYIYIVFNKFILFIYFWLCCVFVAACRLSPVAVNRGGYSSLWCAGFSLRWLLLLQSTGSRRAGFSSYGSRALEHRLSSCGTRA